MGSSFLCFAAYCEPSSFLPYNQNEGYSAVPSERNSSIKPLQSSWSPENSLFTGRSPMFRARKGFRKMKTARSTGRKKLNLARVAAQRRRNLDTLRSIVPGCEGVDAATLFLKTMEHIMKLQVQVHVLRCLTDFYDA